MKKYCVYKHTLKNDGRVYIGITRQTTQARWRNGKGYRGKFGDAIKLFGWNSFEHEIIEENLSEEEARQKEISLIAEHNSTDSLHGFNVSTGGDICRAEGIKVNIYDLNGKYLETFDSINEAQTILSIRNISQCCSFKTQYKKTGNYITRYVSDTYPIGKDLSEKYVSKVKQINAYDLNGKYLLTANSSKEMGELLNVFQPNVLRCCKFDYTHSGNYTFRYLSEEFPAGVDIEKVKIAPAHSSAVNAYDLNGKYLQTFQTIKEAAKYFNAIPEMVRQCCDVNNRRRIKTKEHLFRKLSDEFPKNKDIESYKEIRDKLKNG